MSESHHRHPEFLTARDEPQHRVRCPIHGFIRFSENERAIIDHPLVRRLRYIRQLALTELVYPGATHTRFEHALGVMDVATRAFDTLAAKRDDLLEATFQTVQGFEERPLAKARQQIRLAALLHDAGHASFSHAAEAVVHGGLGHEALSVRIVSEGDLLGGLIEELFGAGFSEGVAAILDTSRGLPPQLQVLHSLVSGEMDADRTDYLLRDSHHCGVDYGRFDYRRMIECLELNGEDGVLEVALHRDGIHTFEALILARYQMNTQVYYHRIRRIYDRYLERYMQAFSQSAPFGPEDVLANNDITMLASIKADAELGGGETAKWAKRIWNREHHRVVHETGVNASAEDLRRSGMVLRALQAQFPGREFIQDKEPGTIHKLLVPEDQDDAGRVRLTLIESDGRRRLLGGESQVLRYIPRRFQCARIFADVSRDEPVLRRQMQEAAKTEWQKQGG